MAKKEVYLADIGTILLQKRRGSRNLRLSINAQGKVRVSQPVWTPFSAGISFARSHRIWIQKHLDGSLVVPLKDGSKIGKHHRITFKRSEQTSSQTRCRVLPTEIIVTSPLDVDHPSVQAKMIHAAEKALRQESEKLLPIRLSELAARHDLKFEGIKIKKLSSRWGSCSSKDDISLSLYLIQLPWPLIDYVLLHELVHTVHKHHGADFWNALEEVQSGARKLRKELHRWQPKVIATD